ncbi:39S ribosomal protein L19, mitochondrial [Clupea harengus]|uniref:Large ribosomal subunit protein bL19m n=1 Tax=Clupea harengus TaxID=7950 RepID=A0A6P3W6R0_CLUHA|nr:39S ribosomal protein L19, mitochondrial [Clupea harengus]
MAACTRSAAEVLSSIRAFRHIQHQHGRFISTSLTHLAVGGDGRPPKFTPPPKPVIIDKTQSEAPPRRFLSPEFIAPRSRTSGLKFVVERKDMIQRRKALNIPEFYVGSILAVTMKDPHTSGKTNRFVGICSQRSGSGLGATFILRNIVDGQGVEICYEMYSPRIQTIEVLKLEKRLDDNLMYLRDALPEHCTFDFDLKPVPHNPTADVPINTVKVRMKPKPWSKRWERPHFNIKGIRFDLCLTPEQMEHAQKWARPWQEFDMMKHHDTAKLEEAIFQEVQAELSK